MVLFLQACLYRQVYVPGPLHAHMQCFAETYTGFSGVLIVFNSVTIKQIRKKEMLACFAYLPPNHYLSAPG